MNALSMRVQGHLCCALRRVPVVPRPIVEREKVVPLVKAGLRIRPAHDFHARSPIAVLEDHACAVAARLRLVTAELDALLRQVADRTWTPSQRSTTRPERGCSGWYPRAARSRATARRRPRTSTCRCGATPRTYNPAAGSPLAWLMTLAHRRAVDRVRSEQAASQRESRYGAANVELPADQVADAVIRTTNGAKWPMPGLADRHPARVHPARVLRRPDLCAGIRASVGEPCHHQVADA